MRTNFARVVFLLGIGFATACGQATGGHNGDAADAALHDGAGDGAMGDSAPLDGITPCGDAACPSGSMCCAYTNQCYDPTCLSCCMPMGDSGTGMDAFDSPPTDVVLVPCVSDSDCASNAYCAGTGCGTSGTCEARPNVCSAMVDPVCGCDGRDYPNACYAAAAGVRVATSGSCYPDGGNDTGPDTSGCASDADCDAGVCCTATGLCYDPSCLACCPAGDAGTDVVGSDAACSSNADCTTFEFCDGAGCDTAGNCAPRPAICSTLFDPVCGCDDRTYSNQCLANSAGVRVQYVGACVPGTTDSGTDANDATSPDAGCTVNGCASGENCCAATGVCFASSCLACCASVIDSGTDAQRDTGADAGCATNGCPSGESCCAATNVCYPTTCIDCCFFPPLDSGTDTGTDTGTDASGIDAGCTVNGCGVGQSCCASTGLCYASTCLGCCPIVFDAGSDVTDAHDATDVSSNDAGCTVNGCGVGLLCCAATGACYAQSCLTCCGFTIDAGTTDATDVTDARDATDTDATSSDAGCTVNGCGTGLLCCPSTGNCFVQSCLNCCPPIVP